MRVSICIALMAAGLLAGQTTFEVASVKPSGPRSERGSEGGPGTKDPTRYTFGKADLEILIMIAYHVEDFQISSPVPLDKGEFDVAATVPAGATKEQFEVMLQNLLSERFHLRLHKTSKEFPAYELVVAKGGPKFSDAPQTTPREWLEHRFPDIPPNRPGFVTSNSVSEGGFMLSRMRAQQQPISRLAEVLRFGAGQPVADRTGLAGKYNFTLEFAKEPASPIEGSLPPAPSLTTALQQQLGLQLVAKKIPFEVLVIDSVDQLPTEN